MWSRGRRHHRRWQHWWNPQQSSKKLRRIVLLVDDAVSLHTRCFTLQTTSMVVSAWFFFFFNQPGKIFFLEWSEVHSDGMTTKLNKKREWNYKRPKDISCPLMAHCVLNIEDISLPDCLYWVCNIPLSLGILGRYRMDQNAVTKRRMLLFLHPSLCGFECTPDCLSEIRRAVICTPLAPCIRVSGSIDKKGGMWAVFISYRCFVCACCHEVKFDRNWIQMHACVFSSTGF